MNRVTTLLVPLSPGPSFVRELVAGRMRWDLLVPFPEQSPEDRRIGDDRVREMEHLMRVQVEPVSVDRDGTLPSALIGRAGTSI